MMSAAKVVTPYKSNIEFLKRAANAKVGKHKPMSNQEHDAAR